MKMRKPITRQQKRIYGYVFSEVTAGVCPTLQEIADFLGLKSRAAAHYHVKTMIKLKWLERNERGFIDIHRS